MKVPLLATLDPQTLFSVYSIPDIVASIVTVLGDSPTL